MAIQAICSCWRSVRLSGFFQRAQRACLRALVSPVGRWLRLLARLVPRAWFQAVRRSSSRASVAQATTWNASAQRIAWGSAE